MGGDGLAGFLDPVGFSWMILLLLLLGTLVLTIGSAIWMLLQPDEPELDTTPLVDDAVRRDREAAALLRRRLDADAGRTDTTAPELR
ncbi:hypothetical protein NLU66_01345 [Brachybacterium sp. NBEC-018]|uniref:hypothetical protein n=1 Tax=Brachybacterium sp. NBEC-018 TaxID=2996004 RepID=UPI0021750B66|nr:hypothetical protein [Brachybacterium sp. NBEC-018]UVY84270.1 hypothetical protein NLU66_01345 [Brachybacterium sp. NBEC-018]